MAKLTMQKIKETRCYEDLINTSYRFHPLVRSAFLKQANIEGCSQIHLLEKMVLFYLNHGGPDTKLE